jgi:hypothetical protein
MILYDFGDKCKIEWNDFLQLICYDNRRLYKSDFKDFPYLYEYIDKNKHKIKNLIFDNYEYTLFNGKLHNLHGPAKSEYKNTEYSKGMSNRYYINGKLVCYKQHRPCKKYEEFVSNEIYFYTILTKEKKRRKQNGIDYIKEKIDLNKQLKNEKRLLKLYKLNDN